MLGDKTVEDRRRPVGRSVGAAVRAIVGGLGGKGVAQVIDPAVAVRQEARASASRCADLPWPDVLERVGQSRMIKGESCMESGSRDGPLTIQ